MSIDTAQEGRTFEFDIFNSYIYHLYGHIGNVFNHIYLGLCVSLFVFLHACSALKVNIF